MTATIDSRLDQAKATLEEAGQAHVLAFADQLEPAQLEKLLGQIESVDWPLVNGLIDSHVKHKPEFKLPSKIEPAPWYPCKPSEADEAKYAEARETGENLIRQGKVAAFTVAGGQGTRLGWDGPKGTYPATPISKTTLFEVFAQSIRKTQEKYGATVPWYILTSPVNDAPTRAFFEENDYFGIDKNNVMLFPQEMMPAVDPSTGLVLMEAKDTIALSPNGHGGSLKALYASGAIDDMNKRGVEQISYVQVDNPLVKVIDPLFIGLHVLDDAQMSSKMLPKAYPKEKLGNICVVDGKVAVIEYSDLPDELAEQRVDPNDPNSDLRFRAGSIAIHIIAVEFVEALNASADGFGLPFHRADKKVKHLDLKTGATIEPSEPNAVKLETFVFDALPLCDHSIVLETDRIEEFAPIKNAEGVDSPASSVEIQTARAARWLEANGVTVPIDAEGNINAVIEISPLTAIEPADLASIELPKSIDPGAEVKL